MAGESVSTTPAPTPILPGPGGKLPASFAQPAGEGFTPASMEALGKLNFQLENKLAGDKETLVEKTNEYNRSLEGQGENEATGFKTLRSRNFAAGLMNSGFALGNRQELARRYTTQRAGKAERQQFGLNRLFAKVQQEQGEGKYAAGGIGKKNQKELEAQTLKTPNEAPPPATGAAAGYPGATAAVNAAFPGGIEEQRRYIKATAKGEPFVRNPGGTAQRAKGGPMTPGHAYLVGERGPELVVPKIPGRVVPNNRLAAIRKAAASARRYQR